MKNTCFFTLLFSLCLVTLCAAQDSPEKMFCALDTSSARISPSHEKVGDFIPQLLGEEKALVYQGKNGAFLLTLAGIETCFILRMRLTPDAVIFEWPKGDWPAISEKQVLGVFLDNF